MTAMKFTMTTKTMTTMMTTKKSSLRARRGELSASVTHRPTTLRPVATTVLLVLLVTLFNISVVHGRPLRSSASYSNDESPSGARDRPVDEEHEMSGRFTGRGVVDGQDVENASRTNNGDAQLDVDTETYFWAMARQDPDGMIQKLEQDKMTLEAQMAHDEQLLNMVQALQETEDSLALLEGMSYISSEYPSDGPSLVPSSSPTTSTMPSDLPSLVPTTFSSVTPSDMPSLVPSDVPSGVFSTAPSISVVPSMSPSLSFKPTGSPSVSLSPTEEGATREPSAEPTASPSFEPTVTASDPPTFFPSADPSASPSESLQPSAVPTASPSQSLLPSESPTLNECQVTPEQRETQLVQRLVEAGGDITLIQNLTTPQGQASDWIINQDVRVICPDDDKLVQRWVVALMYFATGGPNWTLCSAGGSDPCGTEEPFVNERRFLSSVNECQWAGITCNVDACITEIEFENNNLVGTIPTEMALLTDLAIWGMEQGTLTSTIPTEIGTMTNLIFIDFDFNELTGSLPTELRLLTGLTQLDLNDNQLSGRIDGLGSLLNMTFLQLFNNEFTGPIPSEIGALTGMTNFQFIGNQFTGQMPQEICNLNEASGGVLESMIADCNDDNFACDVPTCCTGFLPGCPGTV